MMFLDLAISRLFSVVLALASVMVTSDSSGSTEQRRNHQDSLPLAPDVTKNSIEDVNDRDEVIEWNGVVYDWQDGIEEFLRVVSDEEIDSDERTRAIERLGRTKTQHVTPALVELYPQLQTRPEKVGIILCLVRSQDPRGLPLFARVLNSEEDAIVRLFAAGGLASWNVRDGVNGLIELMDVATVVEQRTVREEALILFEDYNRRKEWGWPAKDVRRAIDSHVSRDQEEKRDLLLKELRHWWDDNQHRFPEWHPGDPLPEIDKTDSKRDKTDP